MEELNLADYLAILRRWKKYFLTTTFVLFGISVLFVLSWSNYRSTATIEIEQPQVSPTMTAPTGTNAGDIPQSLADLRVNRLEEKVTAPSTLVDIITKHNLYPHARNSEPMELIAKKMGDKIKLKLISSDIANPSATNRVSPDQLSAIAFTLTFDYSDPQTAQEILNELVTRFLDEDLKDRRQDAVATADFLESQIKNLEASLADQENRIAKFKDEHGISGPETLMFNQQAAASTTLSMQNLDSQIAANEGTQGSVRAQLAGVDPYSRVLADGQMLTTPATQLKALEAQYATLTAQYGPDHPDVVKVRNQIKALRSEVASHKGSGANHNKAAALRAQISDVSANLAAAESNDGSDNPDVVSLKKQLENLQSQLDEAEKNSTSEDNIKKDADNPAYLALVSQLNALEEQHKSLLVQREKLAAQQAKYEAAITKDPALEKEVAILSRDHDNAELRYRELKERKMAADMDVQMIEDHKGEHLMVISPPDLPLHTHPHRILLLLAGMILSGMGGVAAVVVAQMLNQSVIGARQLTSLLGVAPLVVIPHIYTQDERNHLPHNKMLEMLNKAVKQARAKAAAAQGMPTGER